VNPLYRILHTGEIGSIDVHHQPVSSNPTKSLSLIDPTKHIENQNTCHKEKKKTVMAKPVAIVTGAGSGIGEATATHLHSLGYKVVIADMNETSGQRVAAALGPDTLFHQTDVSSYTSQARLFKRAYEWGGNRLDFCHANAGIDDRQQIYAGMDEEEVDEEGLVKKLDTKTMEINLEAVIQGLWLFKYYVRRSKAAGGGKGWFVATSSAAGL
jgi:15-hydroxyprostaglandin dehydrogenase (NAD)